MIARKILHLAVLLDLILGIALAPGNPTTFVGASHIWKDGQMEVAAASSPLALTWSAFGVLLFIVLMVLKPPVGKIGIPAWWRRFLSSVIDFCFAVGTLAGLCALVPLTLEASRTGHFVWSFRRNYSVACDGIVFGWLGAGSVVLVVLYFVAPLALGRQTIGCFVMRTQVVPAFGSEGRFTWRRAFQRIWYEARGFFRMSSLLAPGRDAEGNTWYDLESGCRVVIFDYDDRT